MQFLLSDIVNRLGGELYGNDVPIENIASLSDASTVSLSFLSNAKYGKQLETTQAGAVIVLPSQIELLGGRSAILSENPYLYFARALHLFYPLSSPKAGVHTSAVIGDGCSLGDGCEIAAGVCIGENTIIGQNCRIAAGVVIGQDCIVGDDVTLYPNVTIYERCVIGSRVIVHAGTVIGADGFGMAWDRDHWLKIPQIGRVVLDDDVEVGANTTIDRGALGDTIIGRGAKIDNLVQVAHNVQIGEHTAIAGCVGIAGSCKIGSYCTIGGAAMFVGHIEIADHTYIGGGTLVSRSITKADHYASSYPLSTLKDWVKNAVHLRHLDKIVKRIKKLEMSVTELNNVKDK